MHLLSGRAAQVRKSIEEKVRLQDLAAGIDKRAVIEKAVRDELCALLDGTGGVTLAKPKKGKPYIVMFVGLQVGSRGWRQGLGSRVGRRKSDALGAADADVWAVWRSIARCHWSHPLPDS